MTKRSELEPEIVREWLKRPPEHRSAGDILEFYGRLKDQRPDLLAFRATGDKYQVLKSILRLHVV